MSHDGAILTQIAQNFIPTRIERYHIAFAIVPEEKEEKDAIVNYPYRIALRFLWQSFLSSSVAFNTTFVIPRLNSIPDVAITASDFAAIDNNNQLYPMEDQNTRSRRIYDQIIIWGLTDVSQRETWRIANYAKSIWSLLKMTVKAPFSFSNGTEIIKSIIYALVALVPKLLMFGVQVSLMSMAVGFDGLSRWFGKWVYLGGQHLEGCFSYFSHYFTISPNHSFAVSVILHLLKYILCVLCAFFPALPGIFLIAVCFPFWLANYVAKVITYKAAMVLVYTWNLLESLCAMALGALEWNKERCQLALLNAYHSGKSLMFEIIIVCVVAFTGGLASPLIVGKGVVALLAAKIPTETIGSVIHSIITGITLLFTWSFTTKAIKAVGGLGSDKLSDKCCPSPYIAAPAASPAVISPAAAISPEPFQRRNSLKPSPSAESNTSNTSRIDHERGRKPHRNSIESVPSSNSSDGYPGTPPSGKRIIHEEHRDNEDFGSRP